MFLDTSPKVLVLPPEIIIQVIESLIPDPKPIALPASHLVTKTLISLAQTCRLTYPTSMRLLYSYCIYIDSFSRLDAFEKILLRLPRNASSFPDRDFHIPLLKHVTSLYIGPFPPEQVYLKELHQIESICRILAPIASQLTRLVIFLRRPHPANFPLRAQINEPIKETFDQMTALEVFCSQDDTPWISGLPERDKMEAFMSWTKWPKLKVLVLGRDNLPWGFQWGEVDKSTELKTLVLRYHRRFEKIDSDNRRLSWVKNGDGGCMEPKVDLFLVYENRISVDRTGMFEEDWKHKDAINTVKVELAYEEGSLQRNRVYRERIVARILDGYQTF